MRITFVIPNDGMTGGIRVVSIYARQLMQRGHIVNIVCGGQRRIPTLAKLRSLAAGRGWPKRPEPEPSYFDPLSIKVRKLETARPLIDSDVPDADVVIATWWETAEWVSALSPSKGAKVYFIQHHEVFSHLPAERSRATYRFPLQKIVISRWLVNIMAEQYGDREAILIPNSVDTSEFIAAEHHKQAVPTAGFVYSKVPFKGADVILKALEQIKKQLPTLRVLAFGAERTVTSELFPEWIKYHYRPPQHEIRRLYSESDVWLCGSRSEGFTCRCSRRWPATARWYQQGSAGRSTTSKMGSMAFWLMSTIQMGWRSAPCACFA